MGFTVKHVSASLTLNMVKYLQKIMRIPIILSSYPTTVRAMVSKILTELESSRVNVIVLLTKALI